MLRHPAAHAFATTSDGLPSEFASNIRAYRLLIAECARVGRRLTGEDGFSVQDLILLCQGQNTRVHREDLQPPIDFLAKEQARIRVVGNHLGVCVERLKGYVGAEAATRIQREAERVGVR